MGAQIFHKSRSHLRILGTGRVTRSKFHTDDPQILGATVQNPVARSNWHLGFLHPLRLSYLKFTSYRTETWAGIAQSV